MSIDATAAAGSAPGLAGRLWARLRSPEFAAPLGGTVATAALVGLALSRLDLWPLEWVMLVPLLYAWWPLAPRRAFFWGWAAGALTHLILFRWIVVTIHHYGGLPIWVGVLGQVLFALAHGLLWAAWLALAATLVRRGRWPAPLALALCYVALAAVFPQLFPWWIGMAQHRLWVAQVADLGGLPLVSALLVGGNAVLAELLRHWREGRPPPWRALAVWGVFLLAAAGYGLVRTGQIDGRLRDAPATGVALLQPNVPVDEKRGWQSRDEQLGRLLRLMQQARAQGADLLVLPESALPFQLWGGPAGRYGIGGADLRLGLDLSYAVEELGRPLITGALVFDPEGAYNVAALLVPAEAKAPGAVSLNDLVRRRYDKRGLLAFGERLPFGDLFPRLQRWASERLHTGGFRSGAGPVSFEAAGLTLAASICYEAILPSLTRGALQGGENAIVNLTNDAWFGEGDERHQHWTLALWRAIEDRVWLLRATNTGRTSVVDPTGREVARAPQGREAVLLAEVRPIAAGSLYRRAGRWWEALCVLLVAAALAALWRAGRDGARRGDEPK